MRNPTRSIHVCMMQLCVVHRRRNYLVLFVGRRKDNATLCMCFVDLQKKAYDSVHRELPWKVLARAGIPEEIMAFVCQCHDRMRARVRMDDGELPG